MTGYLWMELDAYNHKSNGCSLLQTQVGELGELTTITILIISYQNIKVNDVFH